NARSDEDMTSKPATNVDGNDIVAEIAPAPQDIVVLKQKPSGFFGTNMASYLTLLGCDSVIVTGTTTSGCVRATVLDAFSLNYRTALAEEGGSAGRRPSHAINLCDMNAKYADVVRRRRCSPSSTAFRAACSICRRGRRHHQSRGLPRICEAHGGASATVARRGQRVAISASGRQPLQATRSRRRHPGGAESSGKRHRAFDAG